MKKIKLWILSKLSDDDLKGELKRRDYAVDIMITYGVGDEKKEFNAIGKKAPWIQ